MLRALLGMALDTFLRGVDRFTSGSLWLLCTRANGFRTCICVHFRWVPRIFTRLRWVLLAPFTSSTNSLSLSPAFPPHFLSLYWPVPESFICLICASKTVCSNIWWSVSYLLFCVSPPPSIHLTDFRSPCYILSRISRKGVLLFIY